MNKFRQWICVSLLVVGLAGCSSSEQPHPVKVIEIDPDLPAMTEQEMAAHFTGDRFVVLKGALLGQIDRILDWGDRYVVCDAKERQVVIFDTTGYCITQIQRVGKGPGEYGMLMDCAIESVRDELVLYAKNPGKLLWFDRDGKFLREKSLGESNFWEVSRAGDGLAGVNLAGVTMAERTISLIGPDGEVDPEGQLPMHSGRPNISLGRWLICNGAETWLSRPFDYTFYAFDPETRRFEARYSLDLGRAELPESEISQQMDLQAIFDARRVFHVNNVAPVGRYLIFDTACGCYLYDPEADQLMKMGKMTVCGVPNTAVGYRFLENQNRRIVRLIYPDRLESRINQLGDSGVSRTLLDSLIAENSAEMNPVLLLQEVH